MTWSFERDLANSMEFCSELPAIYTIIFDIFRHVFKEENKNKILNTIEIDNDN